MARPHVFQETKIKKKSNDYWKDTILMGQLLDKKKINLYLYDLIKFQETDLNTFHENFTFNET